MTETPTANPAPETPAAKVTRVTAECYTADELAVLLNCSLRHVWRMRDLGHLPAAIRLGRLVRWPKVLIDSWLAAGCPKQPRR